MIAHLRKKLFLLDKKGYKAYKGIQGIYRGDWYLLYIDYVQGDPFASPSRIRMEIPQEKAKFPSHWYHTPERLIGLEDFVARETARCIRSYRMKITGTGKSGLIAIDTPGQEILPRTAVKIDRQSVDIRLSVGLPAAGRSILGRAAAEMLCDYIPDIIEKAVFKLDREGLKRHLELVDQQEEIRAFLKEKNFIAFIGNGSVLPRESGVSNRPLKGPGVIPFQSPPTLEIEIPLSHREPIKGMAVPQGVTLIVGGGYHGKSTLLKGIERGIYNHIPGDGREYVITDTTAFKVRAEDGRRVEGVNISPFISHLPFGGDTERFSTDNASGSTSQAANIMECLEMGCRVLLLDEDTSASNFMIRDARMQALVSKKQEPITPFVDKVRQLYLDHGVSTILVMGGSGDYFDEADHVIMMDAYTPVDVTEKAKAISRDISTLRKREGGTHFGPATPRTVLPQSFDAHRGGKEKVDTKGIYTILFGTTQLDLSLLEQLVDPSQTRAIARMMEYLAKNLLNEKTTLQEIINKLYYIIQERGLDFISPYHGHPGDLALPRPLELAAAINRLRTLKVRQ